MRCYLPPAASPIELVDRPLLASWDAKTTASQVRLRAYVERVAELLTRLIAAERGPSVVQLNVGLGPDVDLLHQRDLDNYLQPIADALPNSVCGYWAYRSS